MPNTDTQSPSKTPPTSKSNGEIEDETKYPESKYKLEDFSQQRINRGQRKINYWIAEADEKIVEALTEISNGLSAGSGQVNLEKLKRRYKKLQTLLRKSQVSILRAAMLELNPKISLNRWAIDLRNAVNSLTVRSASRH